MHYFLALEIFGRQIPDFGFIVPVAVLLVLFLLFNRNGGLENGNSGTTSGGRGRMYQCTKCGRNFQPAQAEAGANGEVRSSYDDRCPNCGWDLDWGNADEQDKKASGGW